MDWIRRIAIIAAAGAALGLPLALLSPGNFWQGWAGFALLCWLSLLGLWAAWKSSGAGRSLAWAVALAFLLRLGIGAALTLALPQYGFDEEPQNAGYVFYDAYRRDLQAWDLAQSGQPILASFGEEFASDQYGGLLGLSALAYRGLSPDAHRPLLVIVLAAFAAAAGVPFLYRAVRDFAHLPGRSTQAAVIAAWIAALYPDGILFGASQMREPFLVGLGCIAFFAALGWKDSGGKFSISHGIVLAASLAGMALISSRVTAAVAALLGGWLWIAHYAPRSRRGLLVSGGVLLAAVLGVLLFSWEWLQNSAWLDLKLTFIGSGWVQRVIEQIGAGTRLPFIIGYGLAQPVLPAAIAAPTLPVWKAIAVFRAAGWYLLAPFLAYALFAVWKETDRRRRFLLLWCAAWVLAWLLISSIRAGGDQWDNPRYRSAFLPWMAFLSAWGLSHALAKRDLWLARWIGVELVFVAFFTNWYVSRYWLTMRRLPFWTMGAWIAGLSALILGSGLLWDLWKRFTRWQRS